MGWDPAGKHGRPRAALDFGSCPAGRGGGQNQSSLPPPLPGAVGGPTAALPHPEPHQLIPARLPGDAVPAPRAETGPPTGQLSKPQPGLRACKTPSVSGGPRCPLEGAVQSLAQSPPLPVAWVPPPSWTSSSRWWGVGCPTAGRSLPCLVDAGHWLPCCGVGPGSPGAKLGQDRAFPSHMGRPVSLPGWGLGTHSEPVFPCVPRMGASPGEPWRLPAPQGHVTPAWAQERRPPPTHTLFRSPGARTGGALVHVPGVSPTAGSLRKVGLCLSLMGTFWLLGPKNHSHPHLPLLPCLPHPSRRAWWAGSGGEQGPSFHDDDLSQDDHTCWDGDMSRDRCSVSVSRTDTIKASESNPGWHRPHRPRADGHPETRQLQQCLCPNLRGSW